MPTRIRRPDEQLDTLIPWGVARLSGYFLKRSVTSREGLSDGSDGERWDVVEN